jgi:uncharacterized OsmC-like protein
MPKVEADFQERKRIVFTTRGRSFVNVRETLDDGPIGFSSMELLLIALGNCSLGTLLNHALLKDVPVRRAFATLESEQARDPSRMGKIKLVIDLEVEDPALLERHDTLERAADACPVGNTLKISPEIEVELNMKALPAAVPA